VILDHCKNEGQLFAARCIWWLACIIQFSERLIYYRHYKIFPSDYIRNRVVTPLDWPREFSDNVLDSDIPKLQLDSSADQSSELLAQQVAETRSILPANRRMRSARIVKPVNLSNKELQKRYPGQTKTQLQSIQESLRKNWLTSYDLSLECRHSIHNRVW